MVDDQRSDDIFWANIVNEAISLLDVKNTLNWLDQGYLFKLCIIRLCLRDLLNVPFFIIGLEFID